MSETPSANATASAPLPPGSTTLGASLLAAAMALPMGAPVQAETAPERGSISLKYLDYLDSQPGANRVAVKAPSLLVIAPLGSDWSVSGSYILDSISGASPAYHTSAITKLTDLRRAGTFSATRYFSNTTFTLGGNLSSERDYLSRGLFMQATLASDDKNTTWNFGLSGSRDVINPTTRVVENERKRVTDLIVGVTQVMGPRDIVQLNLGFSSGSGYFSDPYKVFDNRPRDRRQSKLLARWNHYVEATDGVARMSYRYYSDSFGIRAHTLGLEYVQPLGRGWSVMPLVRYYTQTAARFYVDVDPNSGPFPTNPPEGAQFSSLDQRLSAFGAITLGLKIAKQIDADWLVDLKYEQYGQRASWRPNGAGSPGLDPFNARSVQLGFTRLF